MKKLFPFALIIAFLVSVFVGVGNAATITLVDESFETPDISGGSGDQQNVSSTGPIGPAGFSYLKNSRTYIFNESFNRGSCKSINLR